MMGRISAAIMIISLSFPLLTGCSSASEVPPAAQSETRAAVISPEIPPAEVIAIGPQVGKQAPDFSFAYADGKTVSLSDMRGKAVMLNFWATWCGPCRAEMPLIEELSRGEKWAQRLVLLTVNGGESATEVATFMKKYGYSFPVLLDAGRKLTQTYQVNAIPTTFFIGKDGIVGHVKIGALSTNAEIEKILSSVASD